MSRVLVIGGAGLLGQYVCEEARRRGHTVVATHRGLAPVRPVVLWRHLDLRDDRGIRAVVREISPDLIINAAAMTDVDGCEDRPDEARAVNAVAPGLLAEMAKASGARFVHVSTDYVFDGRGPASETAEARPLGAYGRTKLEGEQLVRKALPEALVLRMSGVFGWNRVSAKTNAVTWVLQKLEAGQEVRLFNDQRITPTYAKTGAEATFDLADGGTSGIFHVASRECLSRFEMGQAVVEAFGIPGAKLVPVEMGSLTLRAARPPAPCLVVRKVEETLKRRMPAFRDCLENMRETR